jgi:undecaprenyl diphosphate synthase
LNFNTYEGFDKKEKGDAIKSIPYFPECLDKNKMPRHIAIIMDGNGRWAKKRFQNRLKGHKKGADTVRDIVTAVRELDIPVLTLYAFSTENWYRPKAEVMALMNLLFNFLKYETELLFKNNIKLICSGQTFRLPEKIQTVMNQSIEKTDKNSKMILNLALSYGGREEITNAIKKICIKIQKSELSVEDIDEKLISQNLYADIPDPDLLIRTGGEMRVSNFLLWQIAYSEFYISKTMWPDFNKNELIDIIKEFQNRKRRFGRV